jgi:hypothetical protein
VLKLAQYREHYGDAEFTYVYGAPLLLKMYSLWATEMLRIHFYWTAFRSILLFSILRAIIYNQSLVFSVQVSQIIATAQ